jgi:hypothetical protein
MSVVRRADAAEMRNEEVRLARNGAADGTDHSGGGGNNWPLVFTTATYGGGSDLWGLGLTPAIVNDGTFGASLQVKYHGIASANALVDSIRLELAYCD